MKSKDPNGDLLLLCRSARSRRSALEQLRLINITAQHRHSLHSTHPLRVCGVSRPYLRVDLFLQRLLLNFWERAAMDAWFVVLLATALLVQSSAILGTDEFSQESTSPRAEFAVYEATEAAESIKKESESSSNTDDPNAEEGGVWMPQAIAIKLCRGATGYDQPAEYNIDGSPLSVPYHFMCCNECAKRPGSRPLIALGFGV